MELSSDALRGAAIIDITSPLSSFHYQVKNVSLIRLFYALRVILTA